MVILVISDDQEKVNILTSKDSLLFCNLNENRAYRKPLLFLICLRYQ